MLTILIRLSSNRGGRFIQSEPVDGSFPSSIRSTSTWSTGISKGPKGRQASPHVIPVCFQRRPPLCFVNCWQQFLNLNSGMDSNMSFCIIRERISRHKFPVNLQKWSWEQEVDSRTFDSQQKPCPSRSHNHVHRHLSVPQTLNSMALGYKCDYLQVILARTRCFRLLQCLHLPWHDIGLRFTCKT